MALKGNTRRLAFLLGPATFFLGICFLGPLAVMLIYSLLEPGLYGGVEWNFYHLNYGRILGWADDEWEDFDPVYAEIFLRSVRIALTNVLITLVICYPAALWVSGLSSRWRTLIVFLITLPFFVSLVVQNPIRLMHPMSGITASLDQPLGGHGRFEFTSENMNLRIWKIAQAARMVEVKVCQNDMLDITWVMPQ